MTCRELNRFFPTEGCHARSGLTDGGAGLENCLWNVPGGLADEVMF